MDVVGTAAASPEHHYLSQNGLVYRVSPNARIDIKLSTFFGGAAGAGAVVAAAPHVYSFFGCVRSSRDRLKVKKRKFADAR